MFGGYVLHYPLTDFAVGLLVIAAMLDVGRIVLKRPQWQIAIDLLLLLGFAGAAVSVGSGLWLVAAQDHGHSEALSIHHLFAYSTLGVSGAGVIAHIVARRRPKLAGLKTVALVVSAALVSGAGFFGGKMAHPGTGGAPHSHDGSASDSHAAPKGKTDETKPHGHDGATNDAHAPRAGSSADPTDPTDTDPTDTKPTDTKPTDTKPTDTKPTDTKPHVHGTINDSHAPPAGSGAKPTDTKSAKPPDPKPVPRPAEPKPDAHDHKH